MVLAAIGPPSQTCVYNALHGGKLKLNHLLMCLSWVRPLLEAYIWAALCGRKEKRKYSQLCLTWVSLPLQARVFPSCRLTKKLIAPNLGQSLTFRQNLTAANARLNDKYYSYETKMTGEWRKTWPYM